MTETSLTDGAGREIDTEQFQTWIIAAEIRGELEHFHGGGAVDPDDPDRGEGFISDRQMRALNIVIRHAVYGALTRIHKAMQRATTTPPGSWVSSSPRWRVTWSPRAARR